MYKRQSFEDIVHADMIAIGDPESVPAGQYGKEALENLDLWSSVEAVSYTHLVQPANPLHEPKA